MTVVDGRRCPHGEPPLTKAKESVGTCRAVAQASPLSANTVSTVHVLLAAMLDAAVDDGLILLNPAKKKRAVNPPTSSQVRAQKPEIVAWTGHQVHSFLTWNRDELNDELFEAPRVLCRSYTGCGLRHTHAVWLLKAGVHPKVVQERLGHETIGITMDIYSHVMPSMGREAAAQLGAMLYNQGS